MSDCLGREFHADAILAGQAPRLLALMFGESGVDEVAYRKRFSTIVPAFDAALALSGHHLDIACFGAGILGADGLPGSFIRGPGWPEALTLYYNLGDGVFDTAWPTVEAIAATGAAQYFRRLPGGHGLADYVANESFGDLIRRAARAVPRGGG